ncbi:single-stranded DNA-binding protein [Corynebacterium pacaense]|uniref:single-stranded DNA-binding protein n=1 Tax=Corynebacterium pacaense TaxID=1816684 RepID=UPI0009BA5F65|nr:single-stranded DNA-binding protein [Corynebacterium pacaense]
MQNNPITITGRITHDPIFDKAKGHGVLKLRVASSRSYYKGDTWHNIDQLYIDVEAWGRLAVNAHQSLVRGLPIIAHGVLYLSQWTSENNERRSAVRLRAINLGIDMNQHILGFRETRESTLKMPDGVTVPEDRFDDYLPEEGEGDTGPGRDTGEDSGHEAGQARELAPLGAAGQSENPPY